MKLRDKKGQIRLTETIAVLFIFFILIGLGIIFFAKFANVAAKEKQQEILGKRAIETTLHTLFMPELLCTKGEAELEENCVDLLKARQLAVRLAEEPETKDYFFNLFGYATISVIQQYPSPQEACLQGYLDEECMGTWIIYDQEKPDWENKEATFWTVSLRDETAGGFLPAYGFGFLRVEVYS
jgi:hypothetical protein